MNILIIGGTRFVGRHVVEAALKAGRHVTLFNRGKSNPGIYPTVETLHGDRDGGLDALSGRQWDVVYDINGYLPRIVRQSAEKLSGHVGRYVFVSSVSVYADMEHHSDEATAPLHELADPSVETITGETYGGLKVLCERVVTEIYGDRGLIVRPGFIVGRYDYAARLLYLISRFKRGGERLAGTPDQLVQIIHARDLAEWMLLASHKALTGDYNLTGKPIPMQAILNAINAKVANANTITYTSDAFLQAQDIQPVDGLTYWVPKDLEGLMQVKIEKALDSGLALQSIDTIIDDIIAWDGLDDQVALSISGSMGAPLTQAREEELLTAWRNST